MQDLLFAVRQLRREPGLSVAALSSGAHRIATFAFYASTAGGGASLDELRRSFHRKILY